MRDKTMKANTKNDVKNKRFLTTVINQNLTGMYP